MNAREEVLMWMTDHAPLRPADAAELLDELLRDNAHELAEKIRAEIQSRYDRDYSDNRIFRLQGGRIAADLIDPEVTS